MRASVGVQIVEGEDGHPEVGDGSDEVGTGEDDTGPGLVRHPVQPGGGEVGVGGDVRHTGPQGPHDPGDGGEAPVAVDDHPVFGAESPVDQGSGHPVDHPVQFAVAGDRVAVLHGCRVRVGAGSLPQAVGDEGRRR